MAGALIALVLVQTAQAAAPMGPEAHAETPDADMLRDLDMLEDPDYARDSAVAGRMSLLEQLRILERLGLLEGPPHGAPARSDGAAGRVRR